MLVRYVSLRSMSEPTLCLGIPILHSRYTLPSNRLFFTSSPRTQCSNVSVRCTEEPCPFLCNVPCQQAVDGAHLITHTYGRQSHCTHLYLAAPSCRSCYPLRYPCPLPPLLRTLCHCAPETRASTDVLPYCLLLLHLKARLHARSQYRTSVSLLRNRK